MKNHFFKNICTAVILILFISSGIFANVFSSYADCPEVCCETECCENTEVSYLSEGIYISGENDCCNYQERNNDDFTRSIVYIPHTDISKLSVISQERNIFIPEQSSKLTSVIFVLQPVKQKSLTELRI
ncbi:MAG: hypothetical protein JSS91_02750 [Bacteroidetes bacterium]|nr:hypothetical protein [Bacteroidota bacterium]